MMSLETRKQFQDVAQAIKATLPLSARKDIYQTKLLLSAGGAVDGSKVQAKLSKPQLETVQEGTPTTSLYTSKSVLNTKHRCLHMSSRFEIFH